MFAAVIKLESNELSAHIQTGAHISKEIHLLERNDKSVSNKTKI